MPIMVEAVMRVRATKGQLSAHSPFKNAKCDVAEVSNLTANRLAFVIVLWQLLRAVYGFAGNACCAAGPVVCDRDTD